MAKKTIIILGGGFGGVVTANRLNRHLKGGADVVLIDRETRHIFSPSFLWLMLGLREPEGICKDLKPLERKGIRYVNAEIKGINLSGRKVETSAGGFDYDYLVISLGAELDPDRVPGFAHSAYNLYTLEGAIRLRAALKGFPGGKVIILVSSTPFKCPAAPYEAAMLIDYYLRKKGLRERSSLQVYTPEPQPMPLAGPLLGNMIKDLLTSRGIGFNPNTKVTSIESDKGEIVFEGDKRIGFDLIVGIPVHKAPTVIEDSGLLGEGGWIPVDKGTLQTRYENVYSIGDVTGIKLPNGKMLPKAGVFAHFEAEVVAENIAREIKGERPVATFDGKGYCFLEMGFGKGGFASGNFYAEPDPVVKLKTPGRLWHWGKVAFERYWMWRWF